MLFWNNASMATGDAEQFGLSEIVSVQGCYEETVQLEDQHIWLDCHNIWALRLHKKLGWKNLGPFRITEVVIPRAYKLDLPATLLLYVSS